MGQPYAPGMASSIDDRYCDPMRDRRLFRAVLLLLLTIALASILIASYSATRIESQLTSAEEFHTDGLIAALSMEASVNETAQEGFAYIVSGETIERDDARDLLLAFDEIVADFGAVATHEDEERVRALLASIVEHHQRFGVVANELFADYEAEGGVSPDLFQEFEDVIDDLSSDIGELIEIERGEVAAAQSVALRNEDRARNSVLRQGFIIGALALVAAAIIAWLFRYLRESRDDARRDLGIHLQALEATTIGVAIGDVRTGDDHVIYVNRGFEEMTGYRRDEVFGKHLRVLDGPRTATEATELLNDCIKSGESGSTIMENYTADGTPMWNNVQISPIRDESGEVTSTLR